MTTIEHTAPAWATEHRPDGDTVTFCRYATLQPEWLYRDKDGQEQTETAAIELIREDRLVTSDSGDISVEVAAVHLDLGEIEEMSADQGPVLVAAVQELLDALNAANDGTPTV